MKKQKRNSDNIRTGAGHRPNHIDSTQHIGCSRSGRIDSYSYCSGRRIRTAIEKKFEGKKKRSLAEYLELEQRLKEIEEKNLSDDAFIQSAMKELERYRMAAGCLGRERTRCHYHRR